MRLDGIPKTLLAVSLSLAILVLAAISGRTAVSANPTVTITAVSGYAGHAFVYAEVNASGTTYPAPTGTTHQSPYYAEWHPLPLPEPNCHSLWGVYVIDRATNTQINPPTDPMTRNLGTATSVCVTPSTTPVDQPPEADATARLDLDLAVTVSPTIASAGSPSLITARLSSAVSDDLDLYLNMAIEDWAVTSWFVDFGDGQSRTMPGGGATTLQVPHIYQTAGIYDARVVASISGHAQAAVYDHYGWPKLIQEAFAVDIGNDALATTHPQALRRYLPATGLVAVTPAIYPAIPDSSLSGFRQISAARGRLTLLAVHLVVQREAALTINGHLLGLGRSRLIGWQLDGGSDGVAAGGTQPGTVHSPTDFLMLQWNFPDRISGAEAEAYSVPITLFVQSRFPDGHLMTYAINSSFSVSVNFAAESG